MITLKQFIELEYEAMEHGISQAELMENAGREFATAVKKKYDLDNKRIIIFCGQGNNGGDGFVAAKYLAQDCPVIILFFGEKEKLKPVALKKYEKVFPKVNIVKINSKEDLKQFHFQDGLELLLVDALLGTGVKGDAHKSKISGTEETKSIPFRIREPISLGMDLFNKLKGIKVAVDLPSGLDPDTGEPADKYCQVDFIVTFHDIKVGLEKYKKKTVIVDIGIPHS